MGEYLGVQIAGALAITAWGIGCGLIFFIPMVMCGWHKYHPVIEMLGAPRLKMGEVSQNFIEEIRKYGGAPDNEDAYPKYANMGKCQCTCSAKTLKTEQLPEGNGSDGEVDQELVSGSANQVYKAKRVNIQND